MLEIPRICLVRAPMMAVGGGQAFHDRQSCSPLTLKYAQALLRSADFQSQLIDCYDGKRKQQEIIDIVLKTDINIIVIQGSNYNFDWAKGLVESVRQVRADIFSVILGPDVTACPDRYKDGSFDVAIKGEAEREILEVIKEVRTAPDRDIIIRKHKKLLDDEPVIVEELDALPFPQHERSDLKKYKLLYPLPIPRKVQWGFMLTSRGCPYPCRFCSLYIRKSVGKTARYRRPESVVDEMEVLVGLGANVISFEDDNFTTSETHVRGICAEIKRRRLRVYWSCHARIDELSVEMAREMRAAGCVLMILGIESGSPRVLTRLNKFACPERVLLEAVKLLKAVGRLPIALHGLFLLGSPGEDVPDLEMTASLIGKLPLDSIQLHFLCLYPDSELYQEFKAIIPEDESQRAYHFALPATNVSALAGDVLRQRYLKLYLRSCLRLDFLTRHFRKFVLFYLLNPERIFEFIVILSNMAGQKRVIGANRRHGDVGEEVR